ncbi:MAG: rhodanese-like domain-containing protein [Bacteroidia bacterium]
MINFIKNLLGGKSNNDLVQAIQNGAIIIDVRSEGEFAGGHVKGSKNIPLPKVSSQVSKIKAFKKPVVLCCASGMRSSQATSYLKKQGVEAYNGGPWFKVNNLINN